MVDPTQILLIVVITVLSVVLVFIGVQVFFILREFQQSIRKVNKMLDDAGTVSEAIAKPIASLSNRITGASGVAGLLGWLIKRKKEKESKEEK